MRFIRALSVHPPLAGPAPDVGTQGNIGGVFFPGERVAATLDNLPVTGRNRV